MTDSDLLYHPAKENSQSTLAQLLRRLEQWMSHTAKSRKKAMSLSALAVVYTPVEANMGGEGA